MLFTTSTVVEIRICQFEFADVHVLAAAAGGLCSFSNNSHSTSNNRSICVHDNTRTCMLKNHEQVKRWMIGPEKEQNENIIFRLSLNISISFPWSLRLNKYSQSLHHVMIAGIICFRLSLHLKCITDNQWEKCLTSYYATEYTHIPPSIIWRCWLWRQMYHMTLFFFYS